MVNKKLLYAAACIALSGAIEGSARAQQPLQDLQFALQGGSYLGIGVREIDASRVQALKLKEERGVEVTSVEQGSPAEMAGIKTGDVVLEFNGEEVQATGQFVRMVHEIPAGRKVKMQLWRNGGNTTVVAALGLRKPLVSQLPAVPAVPPIPSIPDIPSVRTAWRINALGVEAEAIDGQLAKYFGVNTGALVRNVNDNSTGEKAGMKAGDVITKVGPTEAETPREVSRLLREYEGRTAQITAVRDRKEVVINVPVTVESSRGGNRYPSRFIAIGE